MNTFLTEEKNTLIVKQIKTANEIANRLIRGGLASGIDPDEIVSVALIALVKAANRYTGANGASFETYVRHRIRGEILNYLKKHQTDRLEQLSGAAERFYHQAPNEDLLAKVVSVLPSKGAKMLCWRYVDDLSIEEISKKIGTTTASTKTLLGYYCKSLRKLWSENDLRNMLG